MTTHLDTELDRLKNEIEEMGSLVRNQLGKSIDAFIGAKKELAKEVLFQERRVNAEELKIDRDCENIMVLFNPVAIDLRLVFAAFKINSHLERMGDHAKELPPMHPNSPNPMRPNCSHRCNCAKLWTTLMI